MAEPEEAETARPLVLEGHVSLCRDVHTSEWWLYHDTTHELVRCPDACHAARDLSLHFLEDGTEAVLLSPQHDLNIDVDDVFQSVALLTIAGRIVIDPGGSQQGQFESHIWRDTTYQRYEVEAQLVGTDISKLEVATFKFPKPDGCRCMFSFVDIYACIVGEDCKPSFGDWCKQHWPAWEAAMEGNIGGCLQQPQPYRREDGQPLDPWRNLPWRAATSTALLNLATRLSMVHCVMECIGFGYAPCRSQHPSNS